MAELGHTIAAEAADLESGLRLATAAAFDAAILDLQLGPHNSEAIAQALHQRGIPFAFASGFGTAWIPENFKDRPVLQKPFRMEELERCMATLLR